MFVFRTPAVTSWSFYLGLWGGSTCEIIWSKLSLVIWSCCQIKHDSLAGSQFEHWHDGMLISISHCFSARPAGPLPKRETCPTLNIGCIYDGWFTKLVWPVSFQNTNSDHTYQLSTVKSICTHILVIAIASIWSFSVMFYGSMNSATQLFQFRSVLSTSMMASCFLPSWSLNPSIWPEVVTSICMNIITRRMKTQILD